MSSTILLVICINLALILVISWAYIFYKLDGYFRREKKLIKSLQELKTKLSAYRENLHKKGGIAAQSETQHEKQAAALNELQKINESNLIALEELQNADLNQIEKEYKTKLATLKTQSEHFEKLINQLQRQNDSSNYRMNFLETKLHKAQSKLERLESLEMKEEITSLKNQRLQRELEQAKTHAQEIKGATTDEQINEVVNDRKVQKMERELEKYRNQVERQAAEMEQLLNEYEKLENEMATNKNEIVEQKDAPQNIDDIFTELSDIQEELDRTLKEKTFIENQFLDLVKTSEDERVDKNQLDQAKKEYEMLEEHYLAEIEKKNQNG